MLRINRSPRRTVSAIALASLAGGCTVDADVSGKACPCGDAWVCDPAQQLCVPLGDGESAAADWTGTLLAVYLFEQPSPSLGADSSGHELHLQERFGPVRNTEHFMQGAASLEVTPGTNDNGLESTDPAFESPPGTSLTYGGWFRATDGDGSWISPVQRLVGHDDAVGYQLQRNDVGAVRCYVTDNNSANQYVTAALPWPLDEWIHAVCRFDNGADLSEVFVAGGLSGSKDKADIMNAAVPFRLSSEAAFTGQMDEVFFVDRALPDTAIQRIWACGIDGFLCRCRSDQPSEYAHCGRAQPSCTTLMACDTPAP